MNRAQRRAARSRERALHAKVKVLLEQHGAACCICGAVFKPPCRTYVGHASSNNLVEVGKCCRTILKNVLCEVDVAEVSPHGTSAAADDAAWFAENVPRSHRLRVIWPGEFPERDIPQHPQVIVRQITSREYQKIVIGNEECMKFPDDEDLLRAAFDLAIENESGSFAGREVRERAARSVAERGART